MLALFITLTVMYLGIIGMILTENKNYTDYQVRRIIEKDKLFA